MNKPSLARAAAILASAAALHAHAQDATRIVAATVYPDSARVERELKVPGGERHVVIACLPGSVDLTTLQVDGDADLRVGEIRDIPLPATRARDCDASPMEARQQAQALRRSQLEAQRDADELALSYLKAWGAEPHTDGHVAAPASRAGAGAPTPARPGATAGDLRQAALDLLVDQARVARDLADLQREAAGVADAVPAARGKGGWHSVRFDVWTRAAATLHVRYNVANAHWRPAYRATLDAARSALRIDRQAEVVQASGEDWGGVHVTLSTGRANRSAQARMPQPWTLDLQPPPPPLPRLALAESLAAVSLPAPAPMADARMKAAANDAEAARPLPPPWGATAISTDVATEFDVVQPVTLASDGETHTLQLASQTLPATLKRRTTPREDRAVYLLAEAARPAGVWPDGPLQAWINGTLVGRSAWRPAQGDTLQVALGQDDQMRVDIESPGVFTQSHGVFGAGTERTSTTVYAIVNQHRDAVTVELLDAAPVSRNEAIQVTHRYAPQPTATDWNRIPGVAEWTLALGAQQTARVSISHTVSAPKEAHVSNLP